MYGQKSFNYPAQEAACITDEARSLLQSIKYSNFTPELKRRKWWRQLLACCGQTRTVEADGFS